MPLLDVLLEVVLEDVELDEDEVADESVPSVVRGVLPALPELLLPSSEKATMVPIITAATPNFLPLAAPMSPDGFVFA